MRAPLLAIAIVLAIAATALADDSTTTAPDPTPAPAPATTPVTAPVKPLPGAAPTSGKLTLLSPRSIVLDRRHLRTRLEVRCNAAARGACNATGTLTMSAHGRGTRLGGWAGHIPGQQIFAPTFDLTKAVRGLRRGHPLHARLRLTNRTTAHPRVTTSVPSGISTVITLPVTLVVLPPDPPPPPTVTTGVATDIVAPGVHGSDGHAIVAGLVDPKFNSGVTYRFEYGQTAGHYARLAGPDGTIDSADNVDHLVTATMTPIAAPVIHYRLIAFGPTGTTFGDDQHFSVANVFPTLPAPQTDTTAAGLVTPSVLDNHCVTTSVPAMVTGTTLTCSIALFNPQPPVLFGGPTPIAVRPASLVVAADAPQGMLGASSHGVVEPIPTTIAPSTTVVLSANFIVGHPFGGALGEQVDTGTAGPSAAQMPPFAHANLKATLSCTSPKDFVAFCTASVRNTGTDSADISAFSISGEHMTPVATLTGDPPEILTGAFTGPDAGTPVTVKQTLDADAKPPVTTTPTMTVTISGFDDTDRLPVSATATDRLTLVAGR